MSFTNELARYLIVNIQTREHRKQLELEDSERHHQNLINIARSELHEYLKLIQSAKQVLSTARIESHYDRLNELNDSCEIIPSLTITDCSDARKELEEEISNANARIARKMQADQDRRAQIQRLSETLTIANNLELAEKLVNIARSNPEFQTRLFEWARRSDPSITSYSELHYYVFEFLMRTPVSELLRFFQ